MRIGSDNGHRRGRRKLARRTWVLGSTFFVFLGLCGSAYAAPRMALVVRGAGSGSDKAAAFVGHYFQAELAADKRYDLVNFDVVLGNPAFERAEQSFAAARVSVSQGRAAYEEFELDRAKEHLRTALNKFQRHTGHMSNYAEIADIYMLLGAIYSLEGAENKARQTMADAWSIYPQIEPDPRLYNPGMREHFQKAIKIRQTQKRGSLSLSSNPSYAKIYVDGVFRGVTPGNIGELTAGQHHIRLLKPGFRGWGRVVRVKPGRTVEEVARLRPTDHFDDFDSLAAAAVDSVASGDRGDNRSALPAAVEEIGTFLDIDSLMLVDVRLEGETVKVYATQVDLNAATPQEAWRASGEQLFSYDTVPKTYEREITMLFKTSFSEMAMAVPEQKAKDSADSWAFAESCLGMACSTYKQVMVWSSIGAGLAAAGAGGAMWALAKQDNDEYRAGSQGPFQGSDQAAALKSSGQNKALVGDILVGVGVSAVITGTLLHLLWYPGATADDVMNQSGSGWGFQWVPMLDGGSLQLNGEF
ncbi:MAG: PEGA domain-containing protein [Deltaproteobacteria bacterium]|jgi:hypothetical protein|nr:PEGA domain-containing protein [Deltaproteobacteria bacterium]MBT6432099.1 PEGA domain-containing protein [Deltaproteobacteria bacterium]MBT6491820.1 PEGA domain-containing protein [Deltaproteobacteria bacterium]